MNKMVGVFLFFCVCVGLAFSQTETAAPKKTGASQTIRQLEHDWIDAVKAGDTDKLSDILAEDWVGLETDGKKMTRQSMLADVKSGAMKIESLEFGPMDVKVLGAVAVVQGSDTEKSSENGKDTSGKWVWMDVFVKRNDKWVAVRSQSAMLK